MLRSKSSIFPFFLFARVLGRNRKTTVSRVVPAQEYSRLKLYFVPSSNIEI